MLLVWLVSLGALGRVVWALKELERNEREAQRKLTALRERMERDRERFREEMAA